jgi:hypothetical protein
LPSALSAPRAKWACRFGPDPSGQDGIQAFDDEGDVGRVDRPGLPDGPGYVMAVDHQLAQQDAQRGIGP